MNSVNVRVAYGTGLRSVMVVIEAESLCIMCRASHSHRPQTANYGEKLTPLAINWCSVEDSPFNLLVPYGRDVSRGFSVAFN